MLNKIDKQVMYVIFNKGHEKGSCLLKPQDILFGLKKGMVISPEQLETAITNLENDNYIETIVTNTKDKKVYCFTLKKKGEGFLREQENIKKSVMLNIGRTILLAILSFIVGVILKAIFA